MASALQQKPIASQAGPQAYFLRVLADGASQVHSESTVGLTPEPQVGQAVLAQQKPIASHAGPQAYFLITRADDEQTQSWFGSTSTEQNEHSTGETFIGFSASPPA